MEASPSATPAPTAIQKFETKDKLGFLNLPEFAGSHIATEQDYHPAFLKERKMSAPKKSIAQIEEDLSDDGKRDFAAITINPQEKRSSLVIGIFAPEANNWRVYRAFTTAWPEETKLLCQSLSVKKKGEAAQLTESYFYVPDAQSKRKILIETKALVLTSPGVSSTTGATCESVEYCRFYFWENKGELQQDAACD